MIGTVYVLSNPSMPKKYKVGFTTRSVRERIDELYSTGVPDRFILEFAIEVNHPDKLEKVLHQRLGKYQYSKEFFQLDIVTLVSICKQTLISEDFVVHKTYGRNGDVYLTEDEKKVLAEKSKKLLLEKAAEEQAAARKERIKKELIIRIAPLAAQVNAILKEKSIIGKGGFARPLLAGLLGATIILGDVADAISPTASEDGKRLAKKLNSSEVAIFREFNSILNEAVRYDLLTEVLIDAYNKFVPNCYFAKKSAYRQNGLDTTELLGGVFSALKLN
jgi:hypothetical protein